MVPPAMLVPGPLQPWPEAEAEPDLEAVARLPAGPVVERAPREVWQSLIIARTSPVREGTHKRLENITISKSQMRNSA